MSAEEASRVEVLEAEVRRLQILLACAPDFIGRITLDGNFIYLNRFAPGFEWSQVVGTSVFGYIPEAFHEDARAAIRAARETRAVQQYATIGPVSATEMGHYLTRVSPVIEDGEVTSLVMTATDVTLLERQRLLLQLALDATGLGTFSFDPATGEGSWDDGARRVFGLEPGAPSLGDRFVAEYLHPDDRAAFAREIERARAELRFGPIEYRIRLPDGTTRWVSATGATVRDPSAAGADRIVGTLKDITDQRALEARLRDAEKLESIGRLAGGVAHDFNNMLTAILGNVVFAASMESLDEVRPLLEEIRVAAERSAELTAQLLAFARRQLVEPRVFGPNAVIARLEPLLRRLLDQRTEFELSLEAAGHVRLGESQLEQVVMNLVTNARDAVAGAGHVSVETSDVVLDGTAAEEASLAPGAYVLIAVKDDGGGIPLEARPHLFEPFFTTREGGTGLGLATCYGIVRQGGGTIAVESEVGAGARFRVYLPRVEPALLEQQASARVVKEQHKILVVEDEDNVRRVLERALRRGGFVVFAASGANEAMRLAEAHGPFGAVVTDIVMPDVDGHELARRLRKRWPEVRVLFVSGYTQDLPFKDRASDAHSAFLQKPFRPEELLNTVRRLCGERSSSKSS